MRNIPLTDLAKMFKAQAGDWIAYNCIELAHPDKATVRYVCAHGDIVHGGNTYYARGFEIAHPAQKRDALGDGSISIDDTDLEITYWLHSLDRTKRTTLKLFTVTTTDLNVKLVSAHEYRIIEAIPAGPDMAFTLSYADVLREPFPFCRFDEHYPGLYRAVTS